MTIRITGKRKQILDVLKKHKGVFSAKDVHKRLPEMDLVTIYRNLDLFTKEKMIKKVHLKQDEVQYEFQDKPHHHAICADCHKVIHFDISNEKMNKLIKVKDFLVEDVEVTVRGVCSHG